MVLTSALLFLNISGTNAAEAPIYKIDTPISVEIVEEKTQHEYIDIYAKKFETDPVLLKKIAGCESHGDPNAKGDYKNGIPLAIGSYQYHDGTWEAFEKIYRNEYLDEDLDKFSYHDQIKLTAFIFAKHPELRKRWSTFVAYTNGGTYSFYSSLLGNYYTVTCK